MTDKMINTTIEILGKYYPIRCQESEVESLLKAAKFLDDKMTEIQDSGKVINLERIAIIAALNIANQFLQQDTQKENFMQRINSRITALQDKIETAINKHLQTEFIYSTE